MYTLHVQDLHWLQAKKLIPQATSLVRNFPKNGRYVSVVSIIFDCSMPILFTFIYFLATFYIIFGTNILIQCPVPVPVCCMFYVSQKHNIKRNPDGIKTDGELFWNICDFWEEESTRDGARGGHEAGGAPAPLVGHP